VGVAGASLEGGGRQANKSAGARAAAEGAGARGSGGAAGAQKKVQAIWGDEDLRHGPKTAPPNKLSPVEPDA
jgi:hypothetical protein